MYIVTIEEVKEEQKYTLIGTKKSVTVERTIFHQECPELDLVRVIAAVNDIGPNK